jgi:hypothetical protein
MMVQIAFIREGSVHAFHREGKRLSCSFEECGIELYIYMGMKVFN